MRTSGCRHDDGVFPRVFRRSRRGNKARSGWREGEAVEARMKGVCLRSTMRRPDGLLRLFAHGIGADHVDIRIAMDAETAVANTFTITLYLHIRIHHRASEPRHAVRKRAAIE